MKMSLLVILSIQIILFILTFVLKSKGKITVGKKKLLLALMQIFVFYVSVLVEVSIYDYQLEKQLYSFDLNGDGVFSGSEITPEQEEAMIKFIGDTGRTFAPITGAIFSFMYIPFALVIECLIDFIIKRRMKKQENNLL
jgi:hypothetical protein